MGDQGHQCILLSVRQLTETLQELTLMQGQFRAVHLHAQLFTQGTFLDQALFQACDDLRVHAAVMVTSHLSNLLTHPVRKTYYEFVSRAAGVNSLFEWAHSDDR